MKIVIMGAGLMGICSAYFLKKSGHDVVVIDRQKGPGLETSFANGGQISVCYSEPWSSFSNLKKIVHWIGKEDSPILFKPSFNKQQWLWGAQFLYECLPYRNKGNIRKMLKLALYSRKTLQELRKELDLHYEEQTKGILTFYASQDSFEHGIEAAKFMSKFGCDRFIKNKDETFAIEPTLKNASFDIFGSDYTPDDESGDALIFTQKLTEICKQLGVKFVFDCEIEDFGIKSTREISHLYCKVNGKVEKIFGDSFVMALGSYSSLYAKKLGFYLPIYPAKGYSATIPILNENLINTVSLTDMDKKIVLTRIGNKLRIAGTAEFNGYDLSLNNVRCKALVDRTREIHPEGLDFDNTSFWTGLRPATPGNVPIIDKTPYGNLYINSGHGTLGWTMAAGSGKLMEQIINGKELYS